jgi:hypothetical protein
VDIAEAVKYFYEKWLLRDVLSFVTPGALVVSAIALQYFSSDELLTILAGLPLLAYVPIFGALYIIGFGLQNLGYTIRALKWHDREALAGKEKDWVQLNYLVQFHQRVIDEGEDHWLEQTRERINVKTNASGTAVVAITIVLLVYAIGLFDLAIGLLIGLPDLKILSTLFVALLVVALIASLWLAHRQQRKLLKYWEDIVVGEQDIGTGP